MKHAVIVGHPDSDSFTMAVAQRYCAAVRRRGDQPVLRDLYRMDFDPCLREGELPRSGAFAPRADVVAERSLLADADVFVFVYPLWFYDRPAILKGYIDRVFTMGFGYGPIREGRNTPLLEGRRLLSFSSSGAPKAWLEEEGAWAAIRSLLDRHFAAVCGLQLLDHVHFGDVGPGISESAFEDCMREVDVTVERLFPVE
jgi:NAD(P)H dehydrogenase (quinone)